MVIAVIEPVFAGVLVSLFNRYILSGQCAGWISQSCDTTEEESEIIEEEERKKEQEEGEAVSSTNTSISDASVHIHCH